MPSTILLVVCVASILVAQLFILRSAFRAVLASRGDARLPASHRAAEVAWAVLPAIALVFVLWVTWQESRAQAAPRPELHEHSGHEAHAS